MSSSVSTVESSVARIDLPKGGRLLSEFPQLQASVGKSRLLVIVDPDPVLWIADVTRWDEPPGIDPSGQIESKIVRTRPMDTPYFGRERVLEQSGTAVQTTQYAAKLIMFDVAARRRVDFIAFGPGNLADFDSLWSQCIMSFRFVGEARPVSSMFPEPLTIHVDSASREAAEKLLSVAAGDANAERWFQTAVKVKGASMIKSLLLRVQRTQELDEDVTRYTVGAVRGVESPCGGIRFYDSLAEALADAKAAFEVDPDVWTALEPGPDWASTVDDSINSAIDAYSRDQ